MELTQANRAFFNESIEHSNIRIQDGIAFGNPVVLVLFDYSFEGQVWRNAGAVQYNSGYSVDLWETEGEDFTFDTLLKAFETSQDDLAEQAWEQQAHAEPYVYGGGFSDARGYTD